MINAKVHGMNPTKNFKVHSGAPILIFTRIGVTNVVHEDLRQERNLQSQFLRLHLPEKVQKLNILL